MNFKALTLAAILGIATPAIATVANPQSAIAQTSVPYGTFQDSTWAINVSYANNTITYYGENKRTGDNIYLSGAAVGGNSQRRIYTWQNGVYRYQVAWQPSDPDYIRVQVFDGRGRQIFNRLLNRNWDI
ncbi:MAG: hypothetical protein SAJ12_03085 [Jaaginema sp. PMC 1079.18]|nr:hypothetical protein [Jaaginema sp. PMC 1080.18]MEC4849972.1 hypothetical protein [Jaaginema sp. PMC 1079.18]MEC4866933.1 hypothetical protein [Jaaginema sp. PMC 1078.18]